MNVGKSVFCIVFIFYAVFFSTEGFAGVLAQKTLKRWPDPVSMEARLAKEVIGNPLSNLRLYAYKNGSFEPIRYQIDELTGEKGDWIFMKGPSPNKELSNGKLDPWDIVLFMASDTGDKVSQDLWAPGYSSGAEIELIDPLTGEKGWCYLLYFPSNPPVRSSLPNYVSYDYEKAAEQSEYYYLENIITPDGKRTTYYKLWYLTEKAGGNRKSYVDRLKIRPKVQLLFSAITLKFNEELIKSDVLTYNIGPVRINKRVEQYAQWRSLKLSRMVTDIIGYRNMYTCPIIAQFPIKMNTVVSSCYIRFATDFNPDVIGSKTCLSSDPHHWYLVNGKMEEDEKNFNPEAVDKWRLTTGEWGTLLFRTVFPPEIMDHIRITRGIIDDTSKPDPPETYPGCIGMAYQDWHVENVPRGKYYFFIDWYYPINYKPGDEVQYINYKDHPLKIRGSSGEGINMTMIKTELCKKYK